MFTVEALQSSKWYLQIYPGGVEVFEEKVSCFLCKSDDCAVEENTSISFKIEIMSEDGYMFDSRTFNQVEIGNLCDAGVFPKKDRLFERMKNQTPDTLIVQCSLKKDNESKVLPLKVEARTRIIPDKCVFEWRLNFSQFHYLNIMRGKSYFVLENILYELSVAIPQDDVILSIRYVTKIPSSSSRITGKIALLDIKGNELFSKQDTHVFSSLTENEMWELPTFITKQQLRDKFNCFVKDGIAIFLCEFHVSKETKPGNNTNSFSISCSIENLLELQEDFRKLFSEGNHSDAKLRVDNEKLQVHRSVLTARSSVFSAMFDREMLENRTGIVDISDIDVVTLKFFLKFLYTGSLKDMDFDQASKLLVVADKYDVPTLKEECALFLMSALSMENVCQILVLADMIHHKGLKAVSLDFVARHGAEIFSSLDCSDFTRKHPNLCAELLTLAYSSKK